MYTFFSLVLLSICAIAVASDLLVISSLKTATSFIYRSGTNLPVDNTTEDLWRICPHNMPTKQCYPNTIKTNKCTVLTADCRCYNWNVVESAGVKKHGNCVYVKIPQAAPVTKIIWELDYTYPVVPQGYNAYMFYLYKRLYSKTLSLENYQTIMAPLICDSAEKQQLLEPAFDQCLFQIILNLTYTYVPATPIVIMESIGPDILYGLTFFCVGTYMLFFIKT
jgi:hypothetical protein